LTLENMTDKHSTQHRQLGENGFTLRGCAVISYPLHKIIAFVEKVRLSGPNDNQLKWLYLFLQPPDPQHRYLALTRVTRATQMTLCVRRAPESIRDSWDHDTTHWPCSSRTSYNVPNKYCGHVLDPVWIWLSRKHVPV